MKKHLQISTSQSNPLVARFEETLKQKLSQKGTAHQGDEVMLFKAFKYFDLNDNGTVDREEFAKALEKVGLWIDNQSQLDTIFNYYDVNIDGGLDYYEFIGKVYKMPSKTPKNRPDTSTMIANQRQASGDDMQRVVNKVKQRFQKRGSSILDIARQFKIMDDSGDRQLEFYEFRKGMIDFKVGLTEEEIRMVFAYFDSDKQGFIDYDEFLFALKGRMNDFRQKIVDRVFDKLDRNGNGVVEIDDIEDLYRVERHPEYMQGKKTKQQLLSEWLSNFEKYSSLRGIRDSKITREEFRDYYSFISSSIDNDQYFDLMMTKCWKLDDPNSHLNKRGQKTLNESRKVMNNQSSITLGGPERSREQMRPLSSKVGLKQGISLSDNQLLDKLRNKFKARGTLSTFSLGRSFRIIDDDKSHSLSIQEFSKCMNEYRLGFDNGQIKQLFKLFDLDGSGMISYDEFLRGVVGQMNSFRQNLVKQAYKKLDRDGNGVITIADVKGVYNASRHPDVLQGKKSEDQILMEFLETFETHYQNVKRDPSQRNSQVSLDEFLEYYNNISMSIDNDQYFDLMIRNSWNLDNKSYGKGWKREY